MLVACGGDGGSTGPDVATPVATAQIVDGDGQTGVVGTALANPLVALLTDSAGRPLAGRAVRFDFPQDGRWVGVAATTDASGLARATWRLDTHAGTQRAYLQVFDSVTMRVRRDTMTATALPGPAARVVPVEGFAPAARVATPLAPSLVVGLADAYGNRVRGEARVVWAPGSGHVEDAETTVDTAGLARARWVLGETAGEQRITVSIVGGGAYLHVVAAVAAEPVRGEIQNDVAEVVLVRREVPTALVARYYDRFGNESRQGSAWRTDDVAVATGGHQLLTTVAPGRTVLRGIIANAPVLERPLLVPFAVAVATEGGRSYVVGDDGALFTRDHGLDPQIANGVGPYQRVAGLPPIADVAASFTHTCALARDGAAYCWGRDDYDKLGTGTPGEAVQPTGASHAPVAGGLAFTALSAGDRSTCGLTADGSAWCWGLHGLRQPTDAPGTDCTRDVWCSPRPFRIHETLRFAAIDVDDDHTCAIATDGATWCWGSNALGQLGTAAAIGSCTSAGETWSCSDTLVRADTELRFTEVAVDGVRSCARTSGGAVWCWGGVELGASGTTRSSAPVRIDGLPAAASLHAAKPCALTDSGEVWCWGPNRAPALVPHSPPARRLDRGTASCVVTREGLVDCAAPHYW